MKHIFDYEKVRLSVNGYNKLTGSLNSTKHNNIFSTRTKSREIHITLVKN